MPRLYFCDGGVRGRRQLPGRQQYPHLSTEEFDPIFTTVSDLCVEHEHLAFWEVLRLGVSLMTEVEK